MRSWCIRTDPNHVLCGGSICIAQPTEGGLAESHPLGFETWGTNYAHWIITPCSCRPRAQERVYDAMTVASI